jgi:hypothetical protein
LEPSRAQIMDMAALVADRIADFAEDLPHRRVSPAGEAAAAMAVADEFLAAHPEEGAVLSALMDRVDRSD